MDLRQLRYFVAVAEEQHLGRAAERLHLSQPPLTRQIQALEEELGATLFVHSARGMALTQAGEALLKDARSIGALADQAKERVRRAGLGQLGRLDLGVYGSAIFGVVPQLLQHFRVRHPQVELTLHHAQTPAQVTALRQGRVLAVLERQLPPDDDIEVHPVAREPLWVALAASHPLAAHASLAVEALREQTLVTGNATTAIVQVTELCRAHGFEPRLAPPMSDVVVATLLAASSDAVSLVPASMLNVHFPGVAYRPLRSRVAAFMELYCLHLRGANSPLLAALLATVREFKADADAATAG